MQALHYDHLRAPGQNRSYAQAWEFDRGVYAWNGKRVFDAHLAAQERSHIVVACRQEVRKALELRLAGVRRGDIIETAPAATFRIDRTTEKRLGRAIRDARIADTVPTIATAAGCEIEILDAGANFAVLAFELANDIRARIGGTASLGTRGGALLAALEGLLIALLDQAASAW